MINGVDAKMRILLYEKINSTERGVIKQFLNDLIIQGVVERATLTALEQAI
jgi:hypothetical protein